MINSYDIVESIQKHEFQHEILINNQPTNELLYSITTLKISGKMEGSII